VELGPDCVVVHAPDGGRSVVSRAVRPESVADAVLAALPATPSVVIDAPLGVSGAAALADELARRLRRRNVEVSLVDDDGVRCAAESVRQTLPAAKQRPRTLLDKKRGAVAAGALAVIAALVAAAAGSGAGAAGRDESTWVVEGRVAVQVPARWTAERVVAGPGSARVQVTSPTDSRIAIHVTQTRVPNYETMQNTAEALQGALAGQPAGLFTNFNASDHEAGRPAVTYTEIRSAVTVDWVVLVDGGLRIAIGCQFPPAGRGPDPACEGAVRSAHAVL
jgi:type VII secretion-associated protein (TIGR03931 family)